MGNIDWQCYDCETVYRASENAGRALPSFSSSGPVLYAGTSFGDLPRFCPECGDHSGWAKRSEI